ncbi:YphA family membrane protein [Caenibacillus caldisaponilyticus]|uniref:YphA family membrane protein n=1 Tax=Caenibacillus caldisaponilyticus TaxID=1674942 RepID=UPI001177C475|nr:hypothetical protein [Caenibacillus caldisaponilyticus]
MSGGFYFVAWGMWIASAFLMEKGRRRTRLMFGLLLVIILSDVNIPFGTVKVNAAHLAVFAAGYGFFVGRRMLELLRLILVDLILTMLYVLIRIYLLIDPAILLVLKEWMFYLGWACVTLFLVKPFGLRLATAAVAVCQAEALMALLFYPYENDIGDATSFTALTILTVTIMGWAAFEQFAVRLQLAVSRSSQRRLLKVQRKG